MGQLATSLEYVFVPWSGPAGTDLTQYAVDVALIPDNGAEPGSGDWHAGAWIAPQPGAAKEAALDTGPGGPQQYAAGTYMVFSRLTVSAQEKPVVKSGRWRIGL